MPFAGSPRRTAEVPHCYNLRTASDGAHCHKGLATSYESAIREAGFDVLVIPNQGAGAAKARIETERRHFPRIFFSAETTEPRRDTLGWYHDKRSNDDRNVGFGPNHD
jgi:phage terminase large subunit